MLTVDGQRASYAALHDLAHELCGGRWVATGGGGYAVVDVVPRAWTHLLAIVGGRAAGARRPTVPEGWREHVLHRLGRRAPLRMTDGRSPGLPGLGAGLRPGHLAGPGDPRDPDGGRSRCTGSTRCPERARVRGAPGRRLSRRHAARELTFCPSGVRSPHPSH